MAKNNNLGDFLKGLADKFRSKLKTTDKINPQDFESTVDYVYNKGFNEGFSEGGSAGYEQGYSKGESAGKKEEYDTFWDNFQKNGKRPAYEYAFTSCGWTNENFKPKYNIRAPYGNHGNMFSYSEITGSLKQILNDLGITLSFYQIKGREYGATYVFVNTKFTELPVIDFSEAKGSGALHCAFVNNNLLETIEKVILPVNCTEYGTDAFRSNYALKNIDFEGTIKYSLNFKDSPLSADSVNNILNCLDTTTYSGTRTITLKTKSKTAYNDKYGDWDERVAQLTSSGNWTFTLT